MIRTYRLIPSRWILHLIAGGLFTAVSVFSLFQNIPIIVEDWIDILVFVAFFPLVLSILFMGIVPIILPFIEKIVVSNDGLEYHTLAFILWSDWEELVYVPEVDQGRTGSKADVLFPFCPVFNLRGWAKRVPWDLMGEAVWRGIPISWFGGFSQKKFFEAIKRYAPYLEYWES